MNSNADSLIVGIGSAHGDDQIGWLVADEVVRLVAQSDQSQHIMIHKVKSPIDVLNCLMKTKPLRFISYFSATRAMDYSNQAKLIAGPGPPVNWTTRDFRVPMILA